MKRLISKALTVLMLSGLLSGFAGFTAPVMATAGTEPLVGQISLFPYTFTPRGWALCNGATLKVQQNTALFSLLGNRFGGDGITTFCLPDLDQDAPVAGVNYYIALNGLYPSREDASTDMMAIGEVVLFPYTFTPGGFLECAGQELTIAQNSTLYAVLSRNFGDGSSSKFVLPDLRAAVPDTANRTDDPRLHYCMAAMGVFPTEDRLGTEGFVGEIVLTPCGSAQYDTPWCMGQTVNNNDPLYALIGNQFGGSGSGSIGLPDLRGASPLPGMNYGIQMYGYFPPRS